MPPHTTLHYTMPPNTTNSKSTATTTANNGTTQMNTNNKPSSTPTKTTSRQGRSTSASSYVFAPSWLTNLNNKSGSSTTVLNSAYVSTSEEKSVKEEVKGVSAPKKEGLGGIRHAKEGLGKDGSSSFSRSSANMATLPSIRSKSRDLSGSRLSALGETENNESSVRIHGRSRSVSQVNPPTTSSPSSSFDKNFPTLAKKKQIDLSVDLPTKNIENIWANSDTKSKVLSPTCTAQNAEEHTKFNIPNVDDEPELEKFKSLVPKVEKRGKRKISRSLSVDSARGPSVFGFGVGSGIPNGRSLGQTQNARPYLRDNTSAKSTSVQPQRQRAASISTSNGIRKASPAAPRIGVFGQSTITGRKSSIGSSSKYLWSNNAMGKMGYFKYFPEEEEEEDEDDEDDELLNDRKDDVINHCDHIEEEEEDDDENIENISDNKKDVSIEDNSDEVIQKVTNSNSSTPSSPNSSSIEREENFLLQLGWQKPYNNGVDSNEWAITDEEKRFFVNLIRALNGISVSEINESNNVDELSYSEINRAKKKWAALVKNIKSINGGNKIFNVGSQSNMAKHVTFDDENGRNNY